MIQLKTKAETLLINLSEVKAHLRITHISEDNLITNYIKEAQNFIESYISRALTINTYVYTYDQLNCQDNLPTDRVKVRVGKIKTLESVKTYDSDNTETVETIGDFIFINFDQYSYILTKDSSDFPIGDRDYNPLSVEFTAGFDTDLPFDLRQAILKLVANYYEYRESFSPEKMTEIPSGLENILNKYRIELI